MTSMILTLSNRYTKNALNHPQSHPQVQDYACATKCSSGTDGLQMKIQIDLKAADFEQLWINSMEWMNQDWEKQADRFDPKPFYSWKYAYWFDNYAALKMAQGFINAVGSNYAIHSDEATGDWVMLTNYASPCHLRKVLVAR